MRTQKFKLDKLKKLKTVGFPELDLLCHVEENCMWVINGLWDLSYDFKVMATGTQLKKPTWMIDLSGETQWATYEELMTRLDEIHAEEIFMDIK